MTDYSPFDSRVEAIHATVDELVSDFLYYGRKEDEILPQGQIEEAIAAGEITVDDIVARFAQKVREGLGGGS